MVARMSEPAAPYSSDPPPSDQFFALTPDKVLDAVERTGLRCRPVCYALNSFENRVYEIELEDEDRDRVVAKFYRPGRWSVEQIREEHRLLAELADAEIPVAGVEPLPGGDTLATIDGIAYCLFQRRGGRAPDELDDALVERLGMFVGRMHAVGARAPFDHRSDIDVDRYVRRPLRLLVEGEWITPGYRQRYKRAVTELADLAEEALEGVETQRVHGDLHLGNLLLRDGRLLLLDFDDAATGPPVQDIWLALPGRSAETERRRAVFLEGYERFRAFDRSTLRLIEPLRAMRMVRYAGWIALRWDDPSFRRGWPQFGSDEYWRVETDDLEQQLERVRAALGSPRRGRVSTLAVGSIDPGGAVGALRRGDEEDPSELTNADYFWDWGDAPESE